VTQGFRTGGAEQAAKHLADARPQRELVFVWKHQGREQKALTTVRQRPVWKMVPTRAEKGNDWVLWRWRDFYYETSSPTANDLFVNLSARARGGEPGQQLDRVQLWLNDHRVENVPQPQNGTFANVPPFKVDQNEIQTGPVSVRFLAYTRDGGRAEATVPIVFA